LEGATRESFTIEKTKSKGALWKLNPTGRSCNLQNDKIVESIVSAIENSGSLPARETGLATVAAVSKEIGVPAAPFMTALLPVILTAYADKVCGFALPWVGMRGLGGVGALSCDHLAARSWTGVSQGGIRRPKIALLPPS